tara:strand:+ start:4112 stop:4435 length:324 start_codon:yes stop_codon:yes gene_type:complete
MAIKREETKFFDLNGEQVADLTPNHERPLALVDLEVLGKLTDLLKTSDLFSIKRALKSLINDANDIEKYVSILDAEVAFHKTVNLIQEVTKREFPKVEVVGHVDLNS